MKYFFLLGLFVALSSVQSREAMCVFTATRASKTSTAGIAYFREENDYTSVNATISGLEPKSVHGFHIHQYGNMNSDDGTATGGHWNPDGVDHACPDSGGTRHVGDLGNIQADEDGIAYYMEKLKGVPLTGTHGVIGRGMIIHHDPDDCKSQPTGNAGSRLAQCVIGWVN